MKRVIEGKVYNTDTSERVCNLECSNRSQRDFGWHDTTLYKTKNGRFFVSGEGGPRSMWAESVGNGWRSGEGLRAVTADAAREYMEAAHCSAEELIEAGFQVDEA